MLILHGYATFAGTINSGAITSTGKITGTELEGTSLDINGVANINPGTNANIPLELFSDNAGCYVRYDDGDNANRWYTGVNSGIYRVYNNSNVAVFSLNASNNATFAGTVTGTTLTGTSLDINGNADISGTLDVHGNLSLQDNDKLNIGASDDLQIYHDGSDSYIDDTGTGWLRLRGNGGVILSSYSEGETMLQATRNGAVTLYYDNAAKLATVTGGVNITGTLTATADVIAYSDERLKENVQTLDGKKVLEMRGVSFDRLDDGKSSSGVIAQELEKVAPELVVDDGDYKGVAYGNLVGYLIEAVKDQQKQIDELKAMINGNS